MRRSISALATLAMVSALMVGGASMSAASGTDAAGADEATGHIHDLAPVADPMRGVVVDGLIAQEHGGPCFGMFTVGGLAERDVCTHGPDPAPEGVDVRVERSFTDVAPEGTLAITCVGNGTSGNRVHAIYAVASDRPDRFASISPLIPDWAAEVDSTVDDSSHRAGGPDMGVRWITDSNCDLVVEHVTLSPTGDDNFSNLINELKAKGYDRPDRKYLVWTDAQVYCGIATLVLDDRSGQANMNNGSMAMYSRVDAGCWGFRSPVEGHELVHNLGGVQTSAPNATSFGHCFDEYDLLCYDDGSGIAMQPICTPTVANNRLLDCNHDDYFNPSPAPGSYLDTHWNTADSAFLESGAPEPPPASNEPPLVDAGPNQTVDLSVGAVLNGSVSDDGLPNASLIVTWRVNTGPGIVTFGNSTDPVTTASFSEPGLYKLRLTADDGELADRDVIRIVVEDNAGGGTIEVTDKFKGKINQNNPERRYEVTSAAGPATARLTFRGKKNPDGSRQPATATLTILDSSSNVIEEVTSGSRIVLRHTLGDGTYTYVVAGPLGMSTTLRVTHLVPR